MVIVFTTILGPPCRHNYSQSVIDRAVINFINDNRIVALLVLNIPC